MVGRVLIPTATAVNSHWNQTGGPAAEPSCVSPAAVCIPSVLLCAMLSV